MWANGFIVCPPFAKHNGGQKNLPTPTKLRTNGNGIISSCPFVFSVVNHFLLIWTILSQSLLAQSHHHTNKT